MPYGYGNLTSSDNFVSGQKYTRLQGPILVGQRGDNAGSGQTGPTYAQPPHAVNVSTGRGDMLISVVSTFTGALVGTSSGYNVSTGSPTGLVYISMTTGAGNLIAAGSTANAPVGLPGGAAGVALCYDAAKATLALYDPFSSAWLWPHIATAAAGSSVTWSASSS
jgi:hypothetical protein